MIDMPKPRLPHLVRERSRHGKIKWYFRRGKGQRIRLPDEYGSKEFEEAYYKASNNLPIEKKATTNQSGTLAWLVERYMESGKWKEYGSATRYKYGLIFKNAIETSQNPQYRRIDHLTIREAMDRRSDTPAQANNFLRAFRGLFRWALINELVDENPTRDVESFSSKTSGFPVWSIDDAMQFCERWPLGTKPRLAFELFLHSGIRRSDMHLAGPQHMRGNIFQLRNLKTGTLVTHEFPDTLLRVIAETPHSPMRFITKANGEPYGRKESLGNWFGARCRDAGLELNSHGIRKLSATLLAEGGGSAHQLMAMYGWTTIQQAERYTREANRKNLGISSSGIVSDQIKNRVSPHPSIGAGAKAKKA